MNIAKLAAEAGVDVEAVSLAHELVRTMGLFQMDQLVRLLDRFNAAVNPLLETLNEADRESLCLVLVGVSRHLLAEIERPSVEWPALIDRSQLITRILHWGQCRDASSAPAGADRARKIEVVEVTSADPEVPTSKQ